MKKLHNNPTSPAASLGRGGKVIGFFGLGILTGLILLVAMARVAWHSKYYPNITIAKMEVGGLTREQAKIKLEVAVSGYQAKLGFNGATWVVPPRAVEFEIESTLNLAYSYGRRLQLSDYMLMLIGKKTNYPLLLAEGKTETLEGLMNEIVSAVEIPPIEPIIELKGQKVAVSNGVDGMIIDGELMDQSMRGAYGQLQSGVVAIPTTLVKRQLSEDALAQLTKRAQALVGKKLTLTLDDERIVLSGAELIAFLATGTEVETLNQKSLEEYVVRLGESLNREPQDARFAFEDGRVEEFAPGKDGVDVNTQSTITNIQTKIEQLINGEAKAEAVEIVVNRTPPKVTTDKVNELGIKERIGRGESYYAHSIPNRIYNVALASDRINSALIGPGEEVSFNGLVGEVSGATGYRPAYIISGGRTILGDGGGLCQVSTTMFRAAMSAGLPILERWGHAYRVSYYELNSKPGVDATVIAPSKDFRFKNDTPGHILIQTINDPKKLYLVIEIYGTSDGRVATISDPKVWGVSPPPPSIYQDDPSIPAGQLRQVDWSAWGAKASFEYKVVRDGETIQDKTFTTSYRPWANVYLRGIAQ